MKKTKIIASIGPASNNYNTFKKLYQSGMNVARVNFSHATIKERRRVENLVNRINNEEKANIALLFDTKGPEFRTGVMKGDKVKLKAGQSLKIVKKNVIGNKERISVNYPDALDNLSIGDSVLFADGLIKTEVISVSDDCVIVKVFNDGELGSHKSIDVPGVQLDIPFISSEDMKDLVYACEHNCDFLALSFVSCMEDVLEVINILKEHHREDIQIISKIESVTGIYNLDEIIEISDGIMIARGDLGVEVSMEMLPIYQRDIIRKCREAGKICVVATEMLASMTDSIRPTRAEVNDVANAVIEGTDAVMLSEETTIGSHPVEAVKTMASICENTEKYYDYDKKFNVSWKSNITETIAESVITASKYLNSKVIVAATMSGRTARKISNLKPICPILATVPKKSVARSLALNYGVYSVRVYEYKTTDKIVVDAVRKAQKFLKLDIGDTIIISGGFPNNEEKSTNFMKIEEIK